MRVVSNTSPLSNLAIIGRLEFLKRRYSVVLIPPSVASELSALSHPVGRSHIQLALSQAWLRIEQTTTRPPPLPFPLDLGETAAIALALAVTADVLLIDERRGRLAARGLGLAVGGLLGELLHARQQGWIPNLRDEITRLHREACFFVDLEIGRFILAQVGE